MLTTVLRHYGIVGFSPRRVRAGNNNAHWFVGPQYVLRRYREGRPLDTVYYEHCILDHLARRGWPVAPPIAATAGQRVLEVEGRLYALFPRLPGRRGAPERPHDPRGLGRMLARLHVDLATCTCEAPATAFAPLLDVATTWGTGTHTVEALYDQYATQAPDEAMYCRRQLAAVRATVDQLDISHLTRTLIHGDWHAGNLLYRQGEVTGVLDFDFAHPDLRIADVAASAMVLADDVAIELILGYLEVQPLPADELALLNLHERARLLGAIAAVLSIRSRSGEADLDLGTLVRMLRRLEERWPAVRRSLRIN